MRPEFYSFLAIWLTFGHFAYFWQLCLFLIILLNLGQHTRDQERSWLTPRGWIVPSLLAGVLLAQLVNVMSQIDHELVPEQVGVMEVSALLFGPYVLAVELASILLLAGLVAAYHLAKTK